VQRRKVWRGRQKEREARGENEKSIVAGGVKHPERTQQRVPEREETTRIAQVRE